MQATVAHFVGELTIDECEQAVQRLKINKAPGSDGLTLNCIRGGFHGTQHLVFRLSHFNAAIFWADNFCNCLNSSCASFGEKKIEVGRVVFALISIN